MYKIESESIDELGQSLAFSLKWEGEVICSVFLDALTDANFHELRAKLEPIIKKEFKG